MQPIPFPIDPRTRGMGGPPALPPGLPRLPRAPRAGAQTLTGACLAFPLQGHRSSLGAKPRQRCRDFIQQVRAVRGGGSGWQGPPGLSVRRSGCLSCLSVHLSGRRRAQRAGSARESNPGPGLALRGHGGDRMGWDGMGCGGIPASRQR